MDDWIQNKLQSGKTWEGPINCVRKTGDIVPLNSRVIPNNNQGKRYFYSILYLLKCMIFHVMLKIIFLI